MTWETELALAENDTLRTTGDVQGILAKYGANTGDPVWRDVPVEEVLPLFEASWLSWSDALWTGFRSQHIDTTGNVTFTTNGTRQAFVDNVSAQELEVLRDYVGGRQTLAESLGLVLSQTEIIAALETLTDSPQYERKRRGELIQSIVNEYRNGKLNIIPLANLEVINGFLTT